MDFTVEELSIPPLCECVEYLRQQVRNQVLRISRFDVHGLLDADVHRFGRGLWNRLRVPFWVVPVETRLKKERERPSIVFSRDLGVQSVLVQLLDVVLPAGFEPALLVGQRDVPRFPIDID